MTSNDARRVVASAKADKILAIDYGPIRPPFSNEALVKVSTVSLNRGELRRAQNASDGALQIGWDFVGTVDAQAADGSGPTEGTRVVGFSTRMEAWSEYVSIPSNYIAPIPDTVSDAQAATLPVAGLTALHAVDAATSLLGRLALITGATGGVGMYAVQLAAIAGAKSYAQIRRTEQKPFIEGLGDFPVIVTSTGRILDYGGFAWCRRRERAGPYKSHTRPRTAGHLRVLRRHGHSGNSHQYRLFHADRPGSDYGVSPLRKERVFTAERQSASAVVLGRYREAQLRHRTRSVMVRYRSRRARPD